MIFEDNRGNIFLIVSILIITIITGIFMYSVRPRAVIIAGGGEEEIILEHIEGVDVEWEEISISVTEGRQSDTHFRDPTEARMVSDNRTFPEVSPIFTEGLEVPIVRDSYEEYLVDDNEYHVVVKHNPTGIKLTEMNPRVRPDHG